MTYFEKNKQKMFPQIKDFSDPQDDLRNTPGFKLSMGDWFWFNPFAYRFMMVGLPMQFMIVFGGLSILAFVKAWIILAVVFILIFVISLSATIKKWEKLPEWRKNKMNMYDQHLREYRPKNEEEKLE